MSAVTSAILVTATLALLSGTAQAAGLTIVTTAANPMTVAFPAIPKVTLQLDDGTATPPSGGQISLTFDERIYALATVASNGSADVYPVDPDLEYLPVGSYSFVAHYGDVDSAPINVTVEKGNVSLQVTTVTSNGDGTSNMGYSLTGGSVSNDKLAGIVSLLRNGDELNVYDIDRTNTFTSVTLDDAPTNYSIHFWGNQFFDDKVSDPYSKGQVISTTTTTSTTLPTTTTTTSTTTPSSTTTTSTTSTTSVPGGTTTTTTQPSTPQQSAPLGYRLVDDNGSVRSYGINGYGDASRLKLNAPMIAAAHTPTDKGYWLLASDGGIFTFGDARFYGSMGGQPLNKPIVGLAPTNTGNGYWLVASDGGVFAFGDAGFHGSMGGKALNQPIVGITAAADAKGYRMVASDGGIFSFGSAVFFGSMGSKPLNKPVVGMTATPDGNGYWMVASDGGIFAFGNAGFYGSTGSINLNKPIVAMRATQTGAGYWFVASDGGVFAYGNAQFAGSAASTGKSTATVAMS